MADLAGDVDWDDAVAAGLTARDVVVDWAITELTAAEQQEFMRLLKQELGRPGA